MWSPDDGTFNYPTFYGRIVDLFEMYQADKWTMETLAWWNKCLLFALPIACPNLVSHRMVFGHESGRAVTDAVGKNDTDDTDSEWEALHTLRRQHQANEGEALHLRI